MLIGAGDRVTIPKALISHPHGNANVRNAALALAEGGMLRHFWTTVSWNSDSRLARTLPPTLQDQLSRRSFPGIIRGFVHHHPWREVARLASIRCGLPFSSSPLLSPNACAESLDRRVAKFLNSKQGRTVDLVYAYDHGALESFVTASKNGQRKIYELPIGYWRVLRDVLREEEEAWPAWKGTSPTIEFDSPEYLRKDEEISLADCINVPSAFVEETLRSTFPGTLPRIAVVPYGAPPVSNFAVTTTENSGAGPLRVLYAGSLNLRKGTPYLISALQQLGNRVDVTVVGNFQGQCAPLSQWLEKVRWIKSLPHRKLLEMMRSNEILLFPTLFEGYGLVALEAMSQGCALIATPAFGGVALIESGTNGFVVPPRSPFAIAEVLDRLDKDRGLLHAIRAASVRTAAASSWAEYRRSFRDFIESSCNSTGFL